MGFNPAEARDPGGKWTTGGGSGTANARSGGKRVKSGANDLYHIAKAAGISEARLLQLNPGLRHLAGTGRSVPLGVTVATTTAGKAAAAKSQAKNAHLIRQRAASGTTKAARASLARARARKPAPKPAISGGAPHGNNRAGRAAANARTPRRAA